MSFGTCWCSDALSWFASSAIFNSVFHRPAFSAIASSAGRSTPSVSHQIIQPQQEHLGIGHAPVGEAEFPGACAWRAAAGPAATVDRSDLAWRLTVSSTLGDYTTHVKPLGIPRCE